METKKPRLSLEDYMRISRYAPGSIAMLIERFIREMNGLDSGRPIKLLGTSQQYTLRTVQKSPIGAVLAVDVTEEHIIEHAKARSLEVVPATVSHDVNYLGGVLKYARVAWKDCKKVPFEVVKIARPFLVKHGYIGKSTPRSRVPTDEEIAKLLAYFEPGTKKRPKNYIDRMPDMIAFALVSSRRIGEICRITHSDVDWDHKDEKNEPAPIYWVRDVKHPTKKKGNHKAFTLFPELAEIIRRQPKKEGDDRIFPFNEKSVGAKYTRAKGKLGIKDLHFHDCRREAITAWLKKMDPHSVRKFVSGHTTGAVFDRVYDATKAEDGHAMLRRPEAERLAA